MSPMTTRPVPTQKTIDKRKVVFAKLQENNWIRRYVARDMEINIDSLKTFISRMQKDGYEIEPDPMAYKSRALTPEEKEAKARMERLYPN